MKSFRIPGLSGKVDHSRASFDSTSDSAAPESTILEIRSELLARNTVWNLSGQVIPVLVAIAAIPYIVRMLGAGRFAIVSIAWLFLGCLPEAAVCVLEFPLCPH